MAQGIVIAGTHSGCGKTTVTLGILSALTRKCLRVQPFKAGPDFIDAGLHRLATGTVSRNLDLWMCGEDYVKGCFLTHSQAADISVVEGVMGMFDGDFNTARLADTLNFPLVLVIDAYGMAESAGAIAEGFTHFGRTGQGPGVKGIIFNRVASENHYRRLLGSIRGVDVFGYLPRDLKFEIPHRHLGLFVAEEDPVSKENMEKLAHTVLKFIDVDGLTKLAESHLIGPIGPIDPIGPIKRKTRIALAYDKAFCFYYEDNLDLLRQAGAEITRFSPLSDERLPTDADAVYIGGGYPELYAGTLSQNATMLADLRRWADSGRTMYAECGGLMYLSKGIHVDGAFLPMAGVFPFETEMKQGRSRLGYREIMLKEDTILGKKGDRMRGHEFHYSEIKAPSGSADRLEYAVKDASGLDMAEEGYRFRNTLASYIHVHFGSNAGIADRLINFKEG
jgi:cobyrinic acid a,c-diamide synthase